MQKILFLKRALPALLICSAVSLGHSSTRAMDYTDIQISRPGDLTMQCHEISREVSSMEEVIYEAREKQESSAITATGVSVAKTVASYMVGSLGGAIGIMAAGYLVGEATDDRAEDASALEDLAQQRRSFMVGVYNARACIGPLELASLEPAAGDDEKALEREPEPREVRYHYND